MPTLKFSTKGKVLEDLSQLLTKAKVLPVFRLLVGDFNKDSNQSIVKIQDFFSKEKTLIIRSSANNEDNLYNSNAGRFKSILDIPVNNSKKIKKAIKEVIVSYEAISGQEEILIQPMLPNIKISGVVFTADIDTLAPYYIINYDDSGRNNVITSGAIGSIKTYIYFKKSPFKCSDLYLAKICDMCKELEEIFNNPYLDIEFAFNSQKDIYLFQCRPIAVLNKEDLSDIDLEGPLLKIYKKIEKLSFAHPNLLGNKSMFGVMPDWNPAEMIGLKPNQLSLSLYKELITDNVWAYQRDNYGYRNLRSHPLLVSFLGVPYIDVRVDFNSFIPKSLNENIAKKLVNHYLDKLESTPAHHDKVEFEVVHSCYYLNLLDKLKELLKHGFNENEIRRIEYSLLELTNSIIRPSGGLFKKDLEKIELLKERYKSIIRSDLSLVDKIYWLTEDCKRYGTLPFAGIARAAFIAAQFLKSFVDLGIMTPDDYEGFLSSLDTVTKTLDKDLFKLSNRQISKEDFLLKYGHLRPGTYDIMSLRYDENFKNYFSSAVKKSYPKPLTYEFTKNKIDKINAILSESGIIIDAYDLIEFIKEAIKGREYAKFVFTKSLSDILRLIEEFGNKVGISREELSFVDIRTILNLYSSLDHRDVKEILKTDIGKNKEFYKYTKAIRLPVLIKNAKDIYGFFIEPEEPNYITLKSVRAKILKEDELINKRLKERIVFIKSADPGYDFLFTKKIAGLVTQFGGANSHMAIRCAELGIPAVIGAGERKFSAWSKAKMLEINCANRNVKVIF